MAWNMFKKIKEQFSRFAGGITRSSMIKLISLIAVAVYLFCMVAWPIWHYRDWAEIQGVWDRWQALNVGVLAFSASIILWYTADLRSKKNDEKEYKAAKAFLVFVASELCREFDNAANLLTERLKLESRKAIALEGLTFPQHLHPYLERYIKYSDPENAQYIVNLIRFYQVYIDRLNSIFKDLSGMSNAKECVMTSIGDLFNISARTNRLFGYGRGLQSLDVSSIRPKEINEGFSRYGFISHEDSNLFDAVFFNKHSGDIFENEKISKV